jgi:hypothetical protein
MAVHGIALAYDLAGVWEYPSSIYMAAWKYEHSVRLVQSGYEPLLSFIPTFYNTNALWA